MIITIDMGTTNCRLKTAEKVGNGGITEIKNEIKLPVGVGITAKEGSVEPLKEALKQGIAALLAKAGKEEKEIEAIVASGMITSGLGLIEIPHVTAPAGICELSSALVRKDFPEIANIPFYFIPGVRFTENGKVKDMVRGEETELAGLIGASQTGESFVAVMPGSHVKTVKVTGGKLTACKTSMAGELMKAISENTILKSSFSLTKDFDEEYLIKGKDDAFENGVTSALFSIRVAATFEKTTETQLSSYFNGIMLSDSVMNTVGMCGLYEFGAEKKTPEKVLVCGSYPLRSEIFLLLPDELEKREISDRESENAAALGAFLIYEKFSSSKNNSNSQLCVRF